MSVSRYEGRERRAYESFRFSHSKQNFALIIGVVAQCLAWIWGGAMLYSQIREDHETLVVLKSWRDKQDDDRAKIDSHLAVIDQKLSDQGDTMHRIDDREEKYFRNR